MTTVSPPEAPRTPDTYLIIGAVAVLVFLLSFLVTPGRFELVEQERDGRIVAVVDPASFEFVEDGAGSALFSSSDRPGLFNAAYEGLVSGSRTGGAVGIMAFILIVGGAFGIVMATGAIDRGIRRIAGSGGDGRVLLVSLFGTFSLGGAVFGMSEETVPFVLMLVPLLARYGYDGVTVLLVTYVATQIGFATSWMNPFSVAIAQGIAQLPLLSGMPLRIGMWAVFTLIGILFTLHYAVRSRGEPATPVPGDPVDGARLGTGDVLVLLALAAVIVWLVWGVVVAGYYLPEIATQFMVLGLVAGVIGIAFRLNGMTGNGAAEAFRQGATALLPAALVVGFARGIVYLMGGDDATEASLMNSLLFYASSALDGFPTWLAAWSMLALQSVFNFFVTSGSGQAALTMPLMAPLSDLIGVSRQVAVLAFQLGDGLTNIVVPTSAALMGCLGAAGVDWLHWLRAMLRFLLLLFAVASLFVIAATLGGYR
jgi:uncharacterized ion transporter superfamily protein YfcC